VCHGVRVDVTGYRERIRAISGKDVLRVAQRIVRLDAYTEAVVRGVAG